MQKEFNFIPNGIYKSDQMLFVYDDYDDIKQEYYMFDVDTKQIVVIKNKDIKHINFHYIGVTTKNLEMAKVLYGRV